MATASSSSALYDYNGPMYFDLDTSSTVSTALSPGATSLRDADDHGTAAVEDIHVGMTTDKDAPWVFNAPTWSDFSNAVSSVVRKAMVHQTSQSPPKPDERFGGKNIAASRQAEGGGAAYTTPIKATAAAHATSTPLSVDQQKRYEKTGIRKPTPTKHFTAAAKPAAAPKQSTTTNQPVHSTSTRTTTTAAGARKPAVVSAGGRANAPSQHHSYMHSSVASSARKAGATTTKVDNMASFLRPTAASWIRVQKDKEAAAKAQATKTVRRFSSTPTAPRSKPTRSTPLSARSAPHNKLMETTEERQLREAQDGQKKLHKQIKSNQAALERNKYMGSTGTARSTKPLTIPISPAFHERPGRQSPVIFSSEPPAASTVTHSTKPSGPTIPHSPQLATNARAALRKTATQPNEPPAAASDKAATQHHDRDPQHFGWQGPRPLTVPQTPNLQTKQRAALRPAGKPEVGGRDKEDEEALRQQFKALPLDSRILYSRGEMGVPKVTPNEVTQPKPFNFHTDGRKRVVKNDPPPSPPKPKRVVDPSTFELNTERRGKMHEMVFKQKLAKEIEEEEMRREIRARPMPNLERPFMPQPASKELTEFEEFPLKSMERHEHAKMAWEEKLRREEEEKRRQAEVKALPLPISTFQRTFEVKPVDREPLIPMSMNLQTMVRAEERRMFDEEMLSHKAEEEAAMEAEMAMAKQREEEELREYRKLPVEQGGCQFKAKPVQQNVHPLAPAPSNKKLTVPKTPNLLTSKRFHHRPQGPA